MITIPAQRRDAQTTEMKNSYFDSIQIKDSTTNICNMFRIFFGGILKLESYIRSLIQFADKKQLYN